MATKVPEETSSPEVTPRQELSYDEQLELVIKEFGGNKHVGRIRENTALINVLKSVVNSNENKSPTQCASELRELFGAAQAIGWKLSRFLRDGNTIAYDLARHLLEDSRYVLPGTEGAIEKTKPVTVLVLDFKLLCEIAKWVRVATYDHLWDEFCIPNQRDHSDPLVAEALKLLPTAENYIGSLAHCSLSAAYVDVVSQRHPQIVELFDQWMEIDRFKNCRVYPLDKCMNVECYNPLAYVFNGSQDQVLKLFPREMQHQIATWQIEVPKGMRGTLEIGFHPEVFHDDLKQAGVVKSKGVSHGYGAAWIYDDLYTWIRYVKTFDAHPASEKKGFLRLEKLERGDPFAFTLRHYV